MGHMLNVHAVHRDILELGLVPPAFDEGNPNGSVYLPRRLSEVLEVAGVETGRRIGKVTSLPSCFLASSCPVDVQREFVGALFGGDGCTASFSHTGVGHFTNLGFVISKKGSVAYQQVAKFKQELLPLIGMLIDRNDFARITIQLAEHCNLREVGVAAFEKSKAEGEVLAPFVAVGDALQPNLSYQIAIRFTPETTLAFAENIGFRLCVHKQTRLAAASTYFRQRERAEEERILTRDLAKRLLEEGETLGRSVPLAVRALSATRLLLPGSQKWNPSKFKDLRRPVRCPPISCQRALVEFDIKKFFSQRRLRKRYSASKGPKLVAEAVDSNAALEVVDKVQYGVEREARSIPTFRVRFIGRRLLGAMPVLSLSLKANTAGMQPSYLANGILVAASMSKE